MSLLVAKSVYLGNIITEDDVIWVPAQHVSIARFIIPEVTVYGLVWFCVHSLLSSFYVFTVLTVAFWLFFILLPRLLVFA